MTVVYQYTEKEHERAKLALEIMDIYGKAIEKGELLFLGQQVDNIHHFIYLLRKQYVK
jgi:hypothetical protein